MRFSFFLGFLVQIAVCCSPEAFLTRQQFLIELITFPDSCYVLDLKCQLIADPNNQMPINEESTQMSIMLAFFDELDCFDGSRANDLIPLLHLVDILATTSYFKPLISIRNTFPKDTIGPRLDLKHNCLQSAAKSQVPQCTPNPFPNCPKVQCQSQCTLSRVPITIFRPSLHSSSWS